MFEESVKNKNEVMEAVMYKMRILQFQPLSWLYNF